MSLRDQILSADDLGFEIIPVPEWGVEIKIVGLSGAARADYIMHGLDENGDPTPGRMKDSTALLIVESVRDPETDERIFTRDDVAAVNEKNSVVLTRIAQRIASLSGLAGGEKKQEAATEDQFRKGD